MEFLRRQWMQIGAQLEGLTASQKWAIASTLVLGLLLVGITIILAGQAEMVPIGGAPGRTEEVMARFQASGINAKLEGGQVTVPRGEEERAFAVLAQNDLLAADTSEAFNQLVERQSPWQSNAQNEQAYLLAKQRALGQTIGQFSGVRKAQVILSMPQQQGFGATHVKPSASVALWMHGGNRVSDDMVDAVARLVAAATAGMPPENVSVTDSNHGRTRTVQSKEDLLPTEAVEFALKREQLQQRKIEGVLSYIPGVLVAVNVQLDGVQRQTEQTFDYAQSEPLQSEETREILREQIDKGGEPGTRPNTGMSIAGSGGSGTRESETYSTSQFREKPLVAQRNTVRTGHQVRRINVTINVPRRYFVQLYRANTPDAPDRPLDVDLQPVLDAQLAQIQEQVEPLVQAEADGVVRVHMIPDDTLLPPSAEPAQMAGFQGMIASGWMTPASVGFLALMSLALMVWMVRSASRQEVLPTVEELAGLPPRLTTEDELIGEADEGDAAMAGLEVNEEDLKSRKIAEQISEMIQANPQEAGGLLGRWVRHEE